MRLPLQPKLRKLMTANNTGKTLIWLMELQYELKYRVRENLLLYVRLRLLVTDC